MFGELYQSYGNRSVFGAWPLNNIAARTFQWPKFGKEIIAFRPTRSISVSTLSGARVSCNVWLIIT